MIRLRAYGLPAPQGSKRAFSHPKTGRPVVVEQNARPVKAWRQAVIDVAVDWAGACPAGQPVHVTVRFLFPRPLAHYGTGRNRGTLRPGAPAGPCGRPDLDKLARSTLDALTAAKVWADDGQVVSLILDKTYTDGPASQPGAVIEISTLLQEGAGVMGPRALARQAITVNWVRCALAAWCVLLAALVAVLSPWPWGAGAVFPLLAIGGFWRLLGPHTGYHAERRPVDLVPGPDPRAGSMQWADERRYRELHHGTPPAWWAAAHAGWSEPRGQAVQHDVGAWSAGPGTPPKPGAGGPAGGPPGGPPPEGDAGPPTPPPPAPAPGSAPPRAGHGGAEPDHPGENVGQRYALGAAGSAEGEEGTGGRAAGEDAPPGLAAGPDEWDGASLAALATAPTVLDAPAPGHFPAPGAGERMASTMEVEILTPAILELLDHQASLEDGCLAYQQHAAVRWASLVTRPLITTTHQEPQ